MATILKNEVTGRLLETLGLPTDALSPQMEILDGSESKYLRDHNINLGNALKFANLSKKEALMIGLAVAINEDKPSLRDAMVKELQKEGSTTEEIAEVIACTSLLNANNVFYRFRHFTHKSYYNDTPAGIRMNIMMSPVLGKEFFELLSLCISALNGCEMCVTSHEQSVLQHGASEARVYDAIRCTSIFKGNAVLF
jgi:alkyl hydroperoxide reductase subunit D